MVRLGMRQKDQKISKILTVEDLKELRRLENAQTLRPLSAAERRLRDALRGKKRPPRAKLSNSLPEAADQRNKYPMADGLLDYFPNALAEVALVSKLGNEQHNPGQPMHWARGKSTDHRNKIMRHLIDAGGKDERGVRHSAALAWRALANLQEELEREEGYPIPRGSRP